MEWLERKEPPGEPIISVKSTLVINGVVDVTAKLTLPLS